MDKLDRKLLMELQYDVLQPLTALARKLKVSRERCSYRFEQLEKEGVIKKCGLVVDRDSIGFSDVYILVKLSDMDRTQRAVDWLVAHSGTKWVNVLLGQWDLYAVFTAKTLPELNSFIYDLQQEFPIADVLVLPIFSFLDWKAMQLADVKTAHTYVRSKKKRKQIQLSQNDTQILILWADNARLSSSQIAQKIGLSTTAVAKRKKELLKTLVVGTFCSIDQSKLGLQDYKVFIKCADISTQTLSMLKSAIQKEPAIIYADAILGPWQLRVDVVASSPEELYTVVNNLEKQMQGKLGSFTVLQTVQEHKRTSFPKVMQS